MSPSSTSTPMGQKDFRENVNSKKTGCQRAECETSELWRIRKYQPIYLIIFRFASKKKTKVNLGRIFINSNSEFFYLYEMKTTHRPSHGDFETSPTIHRSYIFYFLIEIELRASNKFRNSFHQLI